MRKVLIVAAAALVASTAAWAGDLDYSGLVPLRSQRGLPPDLVPVDPSAAVAGPMTSDVLDGLCNGAWPDAISEAVARNSCTFYITGVAEGMEYARLCVLPKGVDTGKIVKDVAAYLRYLARTNPQLARRLPASVSVVDWVDGSYRCKQY